MSATGRKPDAADRHVKTRRLSMLVFGAALILLFAGVAIASGIGKPSVPSDAVAVVTDMPDGDVTITREDFDRALQQMAAQAQLEEVPAEDDPQYGEIAQAAMNDLLDITWIQGEADAFGITASERQVNEQLQQVAEQNFQCEAGEEPFECEELSEFLEESNYTQDDVITRIEVGVLSNELQTAITEDAPTPTQSQLEAYYKTFQSQFQLPASTDLRVIQAENQRQANQAKAALEEDSSPESWDEVAEEYSNDPVSSENGGLREGVTDGMFEQAVQDEINEAEPGELVGPIEADSGFYVFQVEQRNPERLQDLDEVSEQLEQQVGQQLAATEQNQFINNYRNVWTSRTVCAEDFLNERCGNAGDENVFLSAEAREAQAEATREQAPALANRVAWPKPPNTLTLPIDPVTLGGTQIVCHLEEVEGQGLPITGTAPPQRPHPPGPDDQIVEMPEGMDPETMPPTCGAVDPTAGFGEMPLG